jgi:hypothetical protein
VDTVSPPIPGSPGLFLTLPFVPTRLPHIVVEIGRFMVSGGLSTLTSFAIFNFLAHGPDGGRTAFFVINLITMPLAIACLWGSRHVLGLTDPLSDNIAGAVVGQLIGQAARFYLFRKYVFQQPVHTSDLAHHPVSLLGPAHMLPDHDPASEDRV